LGCHRQASEQRTSYREVFAVAEFRALWTAQVLSSAGDQFAQVAIAIWVYRRTHSAFLTALAYALTYLPPIAGGPLLSGLADRVPRRRVMIACDVPDRDGRADGDTGHAVRAALCSAVLYRASQRTVLFCPGRPATGCAARRQVRARLRGRTMGLLMAAMPFGMVIGGFLLGRIATPSVRMRMMGWLAVLSCISLIGSAWNPPLWWVLLPWALAGAGGAYQLAAAAAFTQARRPATRAGCSAWRNRACTPSRG